ncbi:NAD(P)/FAD-dependent oxidoreductase [Chitinophaga vietnamensis]|uniref:NAD(P)/FAD-dependent oxidoreductase n=1 Tax=Chitinophaga vietnamensis TaxID=2593957 RepID=UPI00117811A7|nr:FAD-binding oxidoreductase [Chitinophaga vietnamensis]
MKQVDYIIAGQGIAGTMLSWFLLKAGKKVLVIDDAKPNSASRVAAGIINPVSGRRFEPAWLYETIYPFAQCTYYELSSLLQTDIFTERELWTVFPSQQMRDAFIAKSAKGITDQYSEMPASLRYEGILDQPFGAAVIRGATVNLKALLPAYRRYLLQQGALEERHLELSALHISPDKIIYEEIIAEKIIFCDGMATAANPMFEAIRFLPNKGEVLLVRIPGLQTNDIIKKGITLVPQGGDLFWAGSTFVWDYTDERPTAAQRAHLEKGLQQLLKIPYTIEGQLAAVRPSGNDRRPVIGFHPAYPAAGIFNGLGTKGCSLAPFMAAHFTEAILGKSLLMQDVDLNRYFNTRRG